MNARTAKEILRDVESMDSDCPRSNAKIVSEIAALSDDLAGLVGDYRDIKRADYESGEDGADDFHADREGVWSDIYDYLNDLADDNDETEGI